MSLINLEAFYDSNFYLVEIDKRDNKILILKNVFNNRQFSQKWIVGTK